MSEAGPVTDLTFRIHHTMLPVADLDRSITFYTRLFGMRWRRVGSQYDAERRTYHD
jgi:catechol 2,3-dioxygenase-like lactoylglutathione lyase family enzyme